MKRLDWCKYVSQSLKTKSNIDKKSIYHFHLFLLLRFLWVSRSWLCLAERTDWCISVDLLVTAQTCLHWRGLLLVSEGRRVGYRSDRAMISKLRFGQTKIAKYWGMLSSSGHWEEGILLRGSKGRGWTKWGKWFLRVSDRHRPRFCQGFIFFQDASRLQPVLFIIGYFRQFFQIKKFRPHSVDILLQRDIFGQKFSCAVLQRKENIKCCVAGVSVMARLWHNYVGTEYQWHSTAAKMLKACFRKCSSLSCWIVKNDKAVSQARIRQIIKMKSAIKDDKSKDTMLLCWSDSHELVFSRFVF